MLETKQQSQPARKHWTAISITAGIIQVINGDTWSIQGFRQRGISQISPKDRAILIRLGLLDRNWESYKELPKNISIHFEDEEVMGKACATFPIKQIEKALKASTK